MINIHPLVKRQTPQSAFSHFETSTAHTPAQRTEVLKAMIERAMAAGDMEPSPAKDAIVVSLQPWSPDYVFRSPVCKIDHLPPTAQYVTSKTRRADGEASYLSTYAVVPGDLTAVKTCANSVQAILYLSEGSPHTDAYETALLESDDVAWDLVSINAGIYEDADPQHPESMARNQMGLVGGSSAHYTSEQWAASVLFWGEHVQCRPENDTQEPEYWG